MIQYFPTTLSEEHEKQLESTTERALKTLEGHVSLPRGYAFVQSQSLKLNSVIKPVLVLKFNAVGGHI